MIILKSVVFIITKYEVSGSGLMMYYSISAIIAGICFSLIWWSCAGQVPPEGGPKDLESPDIVGVYPEPNSTNVDTDIIRFQFSKYVDRQSFQQALFISPLISDFETNWRGRNVEMQIFEPLRENTTYSITVGTDLRDIREGTRLSDAFTLAFSTGDEIDRGQITGRVYYDEPVGVLIFAYQLQDSVMADTLNPAEQEPDYITQTGKDGSFRLPYLRFGTYRIIALRDEFQNRLYDRDVDPYGVYIQDITLTEDNPTFENVLIRMHKPDLSHPFLSRVRVMHNSKISIRFSKPVDPNSMSVESFDIKHKQTEELLDIRTYSIRKEDPSELYLFTGKQTEGEYILTVDSTLTDLYGNLLRSDRLEETFEGNVDDPDTPVTIEYIKPHPDERNIHPDAMITLQFSFPVKSEETAHAIRVVDTNEVNLTGYYFWEDETTVTFKPSQLMESQMLYTVVVELDSLPAKNGLQYEDSLYTSRFTILDRDKLGAIEGQLLTSRDTTFTIKLTGVGVATEGDRYRITRRGAGTFTRSNIPEGQYTLWAFIDAEADGEYDYGVVVPFRGSAPFITYPDTVRVRPRWTVDGIILDMRRYDDIDEPVEAADGLE